jgi:hypothetical protein
MPTRHAFVAPLVAALVLTLPVTTSAQTRIGTTVGLSPLAEGSHAGSLVLGASVIQDEVVRTGPAGALELQFLDGTHLALDRSSSVKLDKFVYSVSRRGDQVVIGLTKGAFRFATGGLPKAAYRIQTPLASIGVRGTILTIVSQRNETRVSLDEGGATVCSRRGARACLDLDPSSPSVVVTRDGRIARINERVRLSLACRQRGSSALFCIGLQRASLGGSVPGVPGVPGLPAKHSPKPPPPPTPPPPPYCPPPKPDDKPHHPGKAGHHGRPGHGHGHGDGKPSRGGSAHSGKGGWGNIKGPDGSRAGGRRGDR